MTRMISLRHALGLAILAVALATGPAGPAAAGDAAKQVKTAIQHLEFAGKADGLKMTQAHAQHALNCLVGPGGDAFDAGPGNPCSGMGSGAINDAYDSDRKQTLEKAADAAAEAVSADDPANARRKAEKAREILQQAS